VSLQNKPDTNENASPGLFGAILRRLSLRFSGGHDDDDDDDDDDANFVIDHIKHKRTRTIM